jgi:hypothetical protein
MKYPDGNEVQLGDQVELWDGNRGTVVCSIDAGEFTDEYPQNQWAYLGSGVLILSEKAGLIHYKEPERELKLLGRGKAN